MVDRIDSVADFKARIKELIEQSKMRDAIAFANQRFESAAFEDIQLREEVTLVHWWAKAYLAGHDLRNMTTKCLTKVNTMINAI